MGGIELSMYHYFLAEIRNYLGMMIEGDTNRIYISEKCA